MIVDIEQFSVGGKQIAEHVRQFGRYTGEIGKVFRVRADEIVCYPLV